MPQPTALSFSERFRNWYEYERDCNAKALGMLRSVPPAARASPQFTRAVGKLAHLVAARHMWLFRLGVVPDRPESWFPSTTLEELPGALTAIEQRWTAYLSRLTDADLAGDFVCTGGDGRRYRWRLLDLLTQGVRARLVSPRPDRNARQGPGRRGGRHGLHLLESTLDRRRPRERQ